MYKREDALKEALEKNVEQTQRWQTYHEDNKTAIENMSMFGKRLEVDVMVPVGKKAFMPGHLVHTNEVLVGHYQGYFSKCTTFKAKEICEFRIEMAKEYLKKLETESELWQNKLDKPYTEGVMPSGEEREIIEDYNEENEKLWKEKHRMRVRQAKQKEREDREKLLRMKSKVSSNEEPTKEKTDDEIFQMLEEAELIEELENELNNIEVDEVNDETIRKLMSGEIKLPEEKKRLSHDNKCTEEKASKETLLPNIVKKNDIRNSMQVSSTNNNMQPNPEILDSLNNQEIDDSEDETLPEEVALIKEQAKFLNVEDQIGFYDYQIQIMRQKLQILPLRTQEDLDEKIRLLNILENLEELLESAEEAVGKSELAENGNDVFVEVEDAQDSEILPITNAKKSHSTNGKNKTNLKRRISFALEDQTLEFRKNETITQMLPTKKEELQRDIIKLDEEENKFADKSDISPPANKKDLIETKVANNLEFVSENQSKRDFDLVEQILQSSMGAINTLHIKFKHSNQDGVTKDNKESSDIPVSPADFYNFYIKSQESFKNKEPSTLFINSYEGEEQVKVPALKEVDRHKAFVDPKLEFSNPSLQAKSILKNKSAVNMENHFKNSEESNAGKKSKKSKKKSIKKDEDECLSAYNKVMSDVVEKPLTEPEPLPDGKFIDAHTPKKRISRFKQMRHGTEKT